LRASVRRGKDGRPLRRRCQSRGKEFVPRSLRPLVLVLAAAAGVGCLRFANTFVWDDIAAFVEGQRIYDLANLPAVFVHDTMFLVDGGAFGAKADLDTYRPLTMATFMLDGAWGGRRPLPFHVTGLAIHLTVIALVYVLGRRLLRGSARELAWAPALWFGLHPQLTEAHVWINGRSDTLCGLFVLASVVVWLGPADRELTRPLGPARALVTFVLALAGALSKEVAVVALVPLWAWRAGLFSLDRSTISARFRASVVDAIPLLAAVGAYLALRLHALGGTHVSGGERHLREALLRVPYFLLDGLWHTLVPPATAVRFLQEEYAGIPDVVFGGAWVIVGGLAFAAFKLRRAVPLAPFGFAWFGIILAPGTLISLLTWYGFARYLYVPAAFLGLALTACAGAAVDQGLLSLRASRAASVGFALYVGVFALLSARATRDWQSSETWYAAARRDFPECSHGWGGWGKVLVEERRYAEAIPFLEAAAERALRTDSRPLNNLAQAWLRLGDPARAAEVARIGVAAFPDAPKFHQVLAVAMASSDVALAADAVVAALDRDPAYPPTHQLVRELATRHPERARFVERLRARLDLPEHARARRALRAFVDAPQSPGPR
jgi:hypothetical protein